MGCEMVWFCFTGVVQPSPNQGPHFQGGMTRGLCFEHLCGTTARKASFPAVLREIYLFIYLFKSGRIIFEQHKDLLVGAINGTSQG